MVNTANAFLGDWKLDADADKKNFIRLEDYHAKFPDNVDAYTYHVQIWDRSGTNRTYEFNMYFSEVGNARFINVPDWMYGERTNEGVYILLEVISVSPANDKITAVPIIDPSLIQMKSSAQIRELITKNLNNPSFYGPEVNFNKVK